MRTFCLITLFACSLSTIIARPSYIQESNEGEAEEAEYDNNYESPAEESIQEDDSRLNNEDTSDVGRNEDSARQLVNREREFNIRRTVAERADKSANDNPLEYFPKSKIGNLEEDAQSNNDPSFLKRRQDRYIDKSYVNDTPNNQDHLTDNSREQRMQNDELNNELHKRTVNTHNMASFEDNDLVFDNHKEHRNRGDKVEYNNDIVDSAEKSRHLKENYNIMQEYRNMRDDSSYEMAKYLNRDRRQAEQLHSFNLSSTSTEKESLLSNNEDDESAIKRHIKKLSGEELEELLNSLSDDKKALLNRIIDNSQNFEKLNKREITKKAGALEKNSYVDSGLSELTKNQGVSSLTDFSTESVVDASAKIENTKQESQTESSDTKNTKPSESPQEDSSDNKAELSNSDVETSNNIKINFDLNSNKDAKISEKIENKRETNPDYLNNQDESFDDTQFSDNYLNIKNFDDALNDQNNFCSTHDEDLQQLADDEVQLHKDYKREAYPDTKLNLDDSIRSLEESFPNSNCDESGKNMAPLIRVKRKENNIKKKAAETFTNDKAAYAPYKAENDDEDNDEGSEFDDDGFYDRTSNYAKSIINKPDNHVAVACPSHIMHSSRLNSGIKAKQLDISANDKLNGDTMSLGSDTDSVLSGVEGVDDNLMYSGGSRNRRTVDRTFATQQSVVDINRLPRTTPVVDDKVEASDNLANIPIYQENDAFGTLPRHESELNRYKRIKRIKPSISDITFDT